MLLIVTLCICAVWFFICRPIAKAQDEANDFAARERFRNFQAFAILKYDRAVRQSPRLSQLSIKDLRRYYNVSDAYDRIR